MGSAKKKSVSSRTGVEVSRRAQRYHQRRVQVRRRVMAVIGAGLVLIAVVLVVMQSSDGGDATTAPFAGSTLNIILGDYSISGDLTAPAGEVRLQAVNNGGLPHNVGVRGGPITGNMAPGKGGTVDLGVLAAGTYELYCDIGDHVQRGMVAELIITEPLSGTSSSVVATS